MRTTPRQLLDDYNDWRNYTGNVQKLRASGRYVRALKLTAERRGVLEAVLSFCEEHHVDPRLWMYSLFKKRHWLYAPRFELGHLTSERHLEYYRNVQDVGAFTARVRDEAHARRVADGGTYDCNRDVSPSVEALKVHLLSMGQAEHCLEETASRTFGFHPRSQVCVRCPVADRCRSALAATVPFDIIALRRGDISSEQARAQAYRETHRGSGRR